MTGSSGSDIEFKIVSILLLNYILDSADAAVLEPDLDAVRMVG